MTQTYRFNDCYGEWEEQADSQGEANIQAAATRVERAEEWKNVPYGVYGKVGYGHWVKPPESEDIWIDPADPKQPGKPAATIHTTEIEGFLESPLFVILGLLACFLGLALYGLCLAR